MKKIIVLALLCLLCNIIKLNAQQLELYSGSASTSAMGPATTATATFYQNVGTSTTYTSYSPATTVTLSFSNQQYTSSTYPGLTIGGFFNAASNTTLSATNIFVPENNVSSPASNLYTSAPDIATAGTNFNTGGATGNYGFRVYQDAVYQVGQASNARNYYGDMTITFSRPVINPVIHFNDMGGAYTNLNAATQGFWGEFELSAADVSAGRTLTRLSGSTHFVLDATNTKVVDNSSYTGATTANYASPTAEGGFGSVIVNTGGTSVTSVTFKVYLRGSGGGGATPNAWAYSATGRVGETFLISATLGLYTISGTVYDDANGLIDNTVNGTGTNASSTIFANLVDNTNTVVASTAVAANGTYSFNVAMGSNNTYTVVLTTSAAATTAALPPGWVNTGEYTGTTAGSDGTVDGTQTVTINSANIGNVNFGIDKTPTAATVTGTSQQNPLGVATVTAPTLTGSDPEDQATSGSLSGKTVIITTLPSNGTLYYNGVAVTAGQTITTYNPALLTVDPNDGISSLTFTYQYVDNAGQASTAATVTMPFTTPVALACANKIYQVQGSSTSTLSTYDPNAGSSTTIASLSIKVNALAYSTVDNLLWAWDQNNFKVVRIDGAGVVTSYTIPNLPATDYTNGTFLPGGYYALYLHATSSYYVVDINPNHASTYLKLVDPTAAYALQGGPTYGKTISAVDTHDWAYDPVSGLIYGIVNPGSTNAFHIISLNVATNTLTIAASAVSGGSITGESGSFGSTVMDASGSIYTYNDGSGVYYKVNIASNTAVKLSTGATSSNSDGASCPTVTLSNSITGTVLNDANGLADNTVNGTGTNASTTLYAILYDITTGKIVDTAVVASNGTYTLNATPNDNYKIEITTNTATIGAAALPAAALPSGWVNTGENFGSGTGSDGTVDGILTVGAITGNTANANFGIEQRPTAGSGASSAVNQNGAVQITVPASTFTSTTASSDPSPGAVTGIVITALPTGATSITINGTNYTSATFPAAGVTVPTDGSGNPTQTITVDPTASGATSVSIPFKAIDAAGVTSSNTGSAVLTLTAITVSGNIYDDANGLTDNTVNKNGTTLNNATVNAVLVNATTNTVVASAAVTMASGAGTYIFTTDGGNYYVMLTTNTATVGSAPPAIALPAGWVSVGENVGVAAGSDGTVDSKLSLGTISTTTTNANFGIDKTPTANAVTGSTQANPGGTGTVTAPTLTGSDPEDGTYNGTSGTNKILIQTLPSNGTLYYNGIAVTAGQTISNYIPALLTLDPNDGVASVTFTVSEVDGAAQASAPATVTMPFTSSISGNIYNDANGLTDNTVNGTGTNAGGLNAVLYDNTTGKVAAVSAVSAGGVYSFNNTPGDNFSVYITTVTATVGASGAPAIVLPVSYGSTGENIGAGAGSDGTPDGILTIGTLGANVANANFGIQTGYYDFGDVPVGYELNNSGTSVPARNAPSNTLALGTGVPDDETAPASVATGSDNNGTNGDGADENGVSSPPTALTVNAAYSLTVSVTNTTGAARTLLGWIDFNNNGIFESTEAATVSVANNATSATLAWTAAQSQNVSTAKLYMRLRIAGPTALADNVATTVDERAIADGASAGTYGTAQIGEVEDYQVSVNPSYDFGDAPVGYESNNSSVSVPARNIPSATLLLGTLPDAEIMAGSVASGADNNGTNGDGSDEDGITSPPSAISIGQSYSLNVTVTNTSGTARKLYGWIDFNNNGRFEASEADSVSVVTGTTSGSAILTWPAVSTALATAGKLYMRLRIASPTALADNAGTANVDERSIADGASSGTYGTPQIGEVEDYVVTAANTDIAVHKSGPLTTTNGSTISYTIRVSNYGFGSATNVTVSDPAVTGITVTGITCSAGTGATGSASCPVSSTVAALQNGTLTIPSLPNASDVTFTVTGTVTGSIGASIVNTATVALPAGSTDADATNNTSTVTTNILDPGCTGSTSTYELDKDATAAANSFATSNKNGGTVNLVYNLTSGTAVTGIGSSFTVTLKYSDLNSLNGTDHQWFGYTTSNLSTGPGAFVISPNAQDLTAGSGSIYNGRPTNNQQAESLSGISNQNAIDEFLTTYQANGSIDLNGTFTTTIGTYPAAPSGYAISSKSFQIQGRNNSNISSPNTLNVVNAAWYVKPIDQPGVYVPGTASYQDPISVEYGNTYEWRYAAFSNGAVAQNASRGAQFYGYVVYKNTSGCTADVSVAKTGPATVSAGGSISYTIVVTNAGPVAANGTTVSDPSVANLTATGITCTGTTGGAACPVTTDIASLQAGTLTIPTLPSGGTVTFIVTGTAGGGGSIANTVTITPPLIANDNNTANNSSTANTAIQNTITGNVYNDVNGLSDNTVNGTGTNAGGLNVIVYDNTTGKVAGIAAVAADGTYTITGLTSGDNFTAYLTTATATVGQTAVPTVTLPSGYVSTGENPGSGTGSDGTANSILPIGVVSTNGSNTNFGIEQTPAAGSGTLSSVNPGSTTQVTVPASTFTNSSASTDPSPGTVTAIVITALPTGATSIVINGTSYTSATFPAAGVTVPTDANGNPTQTITVDPSGNGVTTVTIPFKAEDDAGQLSSNTGSAVISFTNPSISGTVYNDANGLTDNTVNGTGTNAGSLNAVLVSSVLGTNTVIAVSPVSANGTYGFTGLFIGLPVFVEITTNSATIGAAPPAIALPSGWISTGEHVGSGTGSDGTPDGALALGIITLSLNNANLGIEQTPTAGSGSQNSTNAGISVPVTVNPGTFTNIAASTDASPGTIASIEITSFPAGISSISINGTAYTSSTFPAAGIIIPADANGNPQQAITVTPSSAGATTLTIPFKAIDNAGQVSSNTGSAVVNFTTVAITGTVYNDANGLTDNTVNGTGTNAGGTLNAILYDNTTAQVAAIVPVNSNGTYSLAGTIGDNFSVYVTTAGATVGQAAAPAVTTPSGWVNTGHQFGVAAATNTPPGILNLGITGNAVGSVNFGLAQCVNGLTVSASANKSVVCASSPSSVNLTSTPSGGITPYASYVWGGSGLTATNTQNTTANPTVTSIYTVTVADALGCTASTSTGNVMYDQAIPSIASICTPGLSDRLSEQVGVSWTWTTTSGGRFYPDDSYSVNNDSDISHLQSPYIKAQGDYTVNIIDANGCAGTGTTTVGSCSIVLASNMTRLSGQRQANTVTLQWQAANETTVNNYTVERSTDGNAFAATGNVTALNTNSSSYHFTDYVSLAGCVKLYYRVRQNSDDGAVNYSNTIAVNCDAADAAQYVLNAYPNPIVSGSRLTVTYALPAGVTKAQIVMTDLLGVPVYSSTVNNILPAGTTSTITIPVSGNTAAGAYFIRIISDKWVSKTIKIVKQ